MGYLKIPEATFRTVDFTSSGTWVCPSGVYSANFLVVGAGGAGGGVVSLDALKVCLAGGGGGGAVKKLTLPTTPGTSYTITIGAKGTGAGGAAGGNGGFSEILDGVTILTRAFGGRGGSGMNDTTSVFSTATATASSGAGMSLSAASAGGFAAGGGGGALFTQPYFATAYASPRNNLEGLSMVGLEGSYGKLTGSTAAIFYSLGQPGIDGFGAGGGGGYFSTASTGNSAPQGKAPFGAGAGALLTVATTSAVGTSALANTGSGGGGAASDKLTTSRAGGDGGDGLVRVMYFG